MKFIKLINLNFLFSKLFFILSFVFSQSLIYLYYDSSKSPDIFKYVSYIDYFFGIIPKTNLEQNPIYFFIVSNVLNLNPEHIRVRKPGEPYEEYQAEKDDKPYETKLADGEYKDAPKVDKDELVTTEKGKETFLQSLVRDKKERFDGEE